MATHIDPDGDALGSAFALSFALTALGKERGRLPQGQIPYGTSSCPEPAS